MTVETEESKTKIMIYVVRLYRGVPPKDRVYISEVKRSEKIRKLKEELKTRTDGGEQNLVINYREGKLMTRPQKADQGVTVTEGHYVTATECRDARPGIQSCTSSS